LNTLDNASKARIIIIGNIVLTSIILVTLPWLGAPPKTLTVFVVGQVFVLFAMVAIAMGGTVWHDALKLVGSEAPPPTTSESSGLLWAGVVANFVNVSLLVHMTGGVIVSPYNVLPFALLANGQLLTDVPPLDLDKTESPGRQLRRLFRASLKAYKALLYMSGAAYALLTAADYYLPVSVRRAPIWTYAPILVVNGVITMVTNYAARALRHHAPPSSGPDANDRQDEQS
jgi:hypothetical protein